MTTKTYIGTCRYGHTTRLDLAAGATAVVPCTACNNDPQIIAERDAYLTEHPQGFFPLNVKLGTIRGRVSKSHECDGECTHARGDKCICSCGGENHGIGWAA